MTGELQQMFRIPRRLEDAGDADCYYDNISGHYKFVFEDGTKLELTCGEQHALVRNSKFGMRTWIHDAWSKAHPPGITVAAIDQIKRQVSSRDDDWRQKMEDILADW